MEKKKKKLFWGCFGCFGCLSGLGCVGIIGVLIVIVLIVTSPFFLLRTIDCDEYEVINVVSNYRLNYFCNEKNMSLCYNTKNEFGGSLVVNETIHQIDWNNDWIIAQQYPNLQDSIGNRLFINNIETNDYKILHPRDTVYLSKEDSIYKKGGNWYHISNGWNPPDSLYPYKKRNYFHIIKVKYDEQIMFKVKSKKRLEILKDSLGIPKKLKNQLIFKNLK
ncbi:hypothetical protein [uncultured Tenacibaculum sp.]|uniref:hypothetical protein n=1 Tax=uncultured Tenacibaculum sp. TaxID=174713 RepID=UPI002615D838|nr:hypothetical protein [uncultured Tenacibaculum sp.]